MERFSRSKRALVRIALGAIITLWLPAASAGACQGKSGGDARRPQCDGLPSRRVAASDVGDPVRLGDSSRVAFVNETGNEHVPKMLEPICVG